VSAERISIAPAGRQLRLTVRAKGRLMLARTFVEGAVVQVGRATESDVCLPVVNVSRRHVAFFLDKSGLLVTDSSSAGTRVGDQLVHNEARKFSERNLEIIVGPYAISCEVEGEFAPRLDVRRSLHKKLIERLDLARNPQSREAGSARRREVEDVLVHLARDVDVDTAERPQLVAAVLDEALGLGPLESLLKDRSVSEIMVVEPKVIYVEREGRIELTPFSFSDADALRATIERIVTPLGRRIDESSPLVDARLADGSRVNAVIPPLALRGPCLTIRKFRMGALSFGDLVKKSSLSLEMANFLGKSVRIRKNIVISGGTGSGKTTLLNLLSSMIPENERIVTIEDAAELALQQSHVVSLESRPPNLEGRGEITIRDLVKNALRMRPDRIVVGECRGGEALDMLQAMNTGHEGSMTTTHANSPGEALGRLETLCLMSGIDLPVSALRRQIGTSIHLVVQQSRLTDGSRKITAISEVTGVSEQGEVEVRSLYEFQRTGHDSSGRIVGTFQATGYLPTFIDQLDEEGGVDVFG
jgi:pilus assembly protein CpaF